MRCGDSADVVVVVEFVAVGVVVVLENRILAGGENAEYSIHLY